MATYEDRQRQYQEVDEPTAKKKYIASGIRKKFADQFDFGNMSDQEVIQKHYARFGQGLDPQAYGKKLEETYGPGYTAPEKPKPTLGDRAAQVGEVGGEVAKGIVPFVVPEVGKAVALKAGAKAIAGKIPVAGQIGFLAGHAANTAVDQATEEALKATAASLPVPDTEAKTQEFFSKLQPGLSKQGYSDDQIMQEARNRAENIAAGYAKTTASIDSQVEQTQKDILSEPGKAAADAFFLGVGAPTINGVLSKGLQKIGLTKIGEALAPGMVEKAGGTLVGNVARHIKAGAIIGAPGMAIQEGIDHAVKAAADNKTPQEIAQDLVVGVKHGLKVGAVGGAALGGTLGALGEGVGAALSPIVERNNKAKYLATIAEKEVDDARLRGWQEVNAKTAARDLVAHEDKRLSIMKTADSFNPHTAKIPLEGNPADIATTLIQMEHGDNGAMSEDGLRAASKIADKIQLFQDSEKALGGRTVELPTGEPSTATLPVGAPLNPEGGVAPEPNAPGAVQGPIGEQTPQFRPPTQRIEPAQGLEGLPAPSRAPVQEPVTGAAPQLPVEKSREVNPAAQHVVKMYSKAAGIPEVPGREMHPKIDKGRAEQIAQQYHDLKNAEPGTPEFEQARKSYASLNEQIAKQFKAIKDAGFKIEFVSEDPYKSSAEMRQDVRDNKRLKVFESQESHHPLMTKKQTDMFRAVHDFFGHAAEGFEFGPRGEEAAFRQHAATLTNDAIPALASETRGQNSWVNFFPENAKLEPAKRPFAEQKAGLLPREAYADVLHTETLPASAVEALPAPGATPAPEAAPALSTGVQKAVDALKDETHANVMVSPDGTALRISLGVKPDQVAKPGGHATALDRIVKTADEHGVRVETDLVPPPGPRGGRIPLEKVIPWYESRGFKVTETTRIPEGNLATAKLVREPIGEHQADVAAKLDKIAEGARKRIAKRGSQLSSGIDPAAIGDYALELAADMFSRRLRRKSEIESWIVQKWGDVAKPLMDKLIATAQRHFVRMFSTSGKAEKGLNTLLALGESGKHGANWYEGTAKWAKQQFGEDADMMLRFLAVTSANGQTESGAAMALKAFAQWKAGMPFEGYRGQSMVGQLERIAKGENLGKNTKIQNFYDALAGDPNAVVLDRWMMNALGMKIKTEGGSGNLSESNYKIYSQVVKDLAEMNDMTPRQFQAAVWEGARVRKAHLTEKEGGRALTTKSGSARPLEDLVTRKLGGMSIDQYIQENKGNLEGMEKLYQGLAPVRKGESSGHTFNVDTFEPDNKPGYVVSLVSTNVDKKSLYPGEVLKFKKMVEPLIREMQSEGFDPHVSTAKHVTIGIFASDLHPGQFSVDLNITLPSREEAYRIATLNRQESFAHLGPNGEWIENVPTGYKEKKHGKQFLPPSRYSERPAWFKQQMNRARHFIAGQQELQ